MGRRGRGIWWISWGSRGWREEGVGWEYFLVGRGKRIIVRKGREEVRTVFFCEKREEREICILEKNKKRRMRKTTPASFSLEASPSQVASPFLPFLDSPVFRAILPLRST